MFKKRELKLKIINILGTTMMLTSQISSAAIVYKDHGFLPPVKSDIFNLLDIRLGTVTTAEINKKARVPSLKITMDFGTKFDDLKQSSAQLQDNYYEGAIDRKEISEEGRDKRKLQGMQIAAVTNFPMRSVGIPSYFLTLGVVSLEGESSGTVVIHPILPVPNGIQVKLINDDIPSADSTFRLPQTKYEESFVYLDIRIGTVLSTVEKSVYFGEKLGIFVYKGDYPFIKKGMQILRAINLIDLAKEDNFLGVVTLEGEKIPLTLERSLPDGHFLK